MFMDEQSLWMKKMMEFFMNVANILFLQKIEQRNKVEEIYVH